ncbi:MAG: DUF3467 domain-containing protein [Rhodospirillales bacterium]|nr:DUF3467 domain-containing protein [Rhodospirillales bacterium]
MSENTVRPHTPPLPERAEDFTDSFANVFRMGISSNDFTLIFSTLDERGPGHPRLCDRASLHVSPQMLKMLSLQIAMNVEAYESAFGPIKIPKQFEQSNDTQRTELKKQFDHLANG